MDISIKRAAETLLGGGVIAYPTEGVYGLGCMPDDPDAIARLLDIKERDPSKGLILLAASRQQLSGWAEPDDIARLPAPDPQKPTTWIVRRGPRTSALLRGANPGIAVRISTNPIACAICDAVQSPITSTSANLSGRPIVRNNIQLRRQFQRLVDYIVPGYCGPSTSPSEIRSLHDGTVLRT